MPCNLTEIEASLAAACFRWREKVKSTGKGAFADFRVILHSDRKEAFTNIIKAGSGEVLDVRYDLFFPNSSHSTKIEFITAHHM